MNLVFSALSAASIILLLFLKPSATLPAFTEGAINALRLSLTLFSSYAFWLPIIGILEKSGVTEKLQKLFEPLIKRLFPGEKADTLTYISTNFAANFIGAGGAATPEGLKAAAGIADRKNLVTLVVMNSTAFQLIPTTVVAMRASLNAATDIILPSLVAAAITNITALILTKIFVK